MTGLRIAPTDVLFWVHFDTKTNRATVYRRNWGHETPRAAIKAWREEMRRDADWHERAAALLRKRAAGVVRKGWPK